ncbi:MAG: hypothetical protein K6F23_09215, partial [Solobacterium sp.]|nr:hypothetical protein [Solobacterium sp.]
MGDLSYFIEHWNTDMVSVGAVICLILLVSGYFYGKIIQNYVEPLKKIDCTFLGIFFIFAVFQIATFYFVAQETSTEIAFMGVALLILISPLLCLLTWSSPLPNWANLFTLVIGAGLVYLLGTVSAGLNTNNIFFDSIHYLSAALESSVQKVFAHINFYNGVYHYNIDQFHDFEGFSYFWGMMLKWTGKLTDLEESLTPVYIWGASFLYWMSLGSLISSSVCVLFKKWWKIIGFAAVILFIAPYYTNYWNTTLAFFGNSLRTIVIGFSVLIAYQFAETMDGRLFIPQTICTYAALFCSSSGFFIEAFITIGMLFVMLWRDERKLSNYIWMILSTVPFFHYAVLILTQYYRYYWQALPRYALPVVILIVIAVLLRNHLDIFNKIFKWLLPAAFIGLAAVSFLKRGGEYPYSFYFAQRSNMDMCNNFTGFYEERDFLRNIILYVMLAFLLVRPKTEGKFKFFLLIVGLLFLNPLVQPAVSNYMTSAVYSRSFDIIVNPFTLAFLVANVCETFKTE